ncbi:MAG: extracellular solute-binding protein [Gammaproteobacteria bacterium]|nr:extracellular solute-binding protein [Gammaproteobacteria bacterium]
MKKFRLVLSLILAFLAVFTLVGCKESTNPSGDFGITLEEIIANAKKLSYSDQGQGQQQVTGTPNFNVPEGGYDGSAVTIKFYHTMGKNLVTVLDKYIKKFNEIYPNITVDQKQIGNYDGVRDQISTELPAGNEPNIAYCYPDHVALYNLTGKVVHLDNLINSTIADDARNGGQIGLTAAQKADFIKGYYEEGSQFGDGLMYTMPFSKSTEVLYYNETFFTANSIPVPTHWFNESEDDTTSLEAVCKKIKELKPDCIPLGYDSEANWFITMAEQCGADYTSATGDHYLFSNPTMKTLMAKFREWYQLGYITTQKLYGSYTSGLFVADENDSSTTNSYMSIGSSAGATHQRPEKVTVTKEDGTESSEYPFVVGIASIPQMSTTYQRVISQGPSVCIFNKSNPQEVVASWLLVKYLTTSTIFQAEFSSVSGYVPVLHSVAQNEQYAKMIAKADGTTNIAYLSAKVCLEQADFYYTSPAFNGSSVARDQVGALLTTILSKEADNAVKMINDAFQDAIDECEYQG